MLELRLHNTLWKQTNSIWDLVMCCNHMVIQIVPGSLSSQCDRRGAAGGLCSLCASSEV